jgi:hypothetical protein
MTGRGVGGCPLGEMAAAKNRDMGMDGFGSTARMTVKCQRNFKKFCFKRLEKILYIYYCILKYLMFDFFISTLTTSYSKYFKNIKN